MKGELNSTGQGSNRNQESSAESIFSRFIAPMSKTPDALPEGFVPQHHSPPEPYNDSSIDFPEWKSIFCNDLKLTDTNGGLRSQKVSRNIAEIVDALQHRLEFASVSDSLAVYEPPCWRVMNRGETVRFISETVRNLFPEDAKYLSSRQRAEIAEQLLCHSETHQLREVPPPDYHYLCCRDCMYDWRSGECLPHDSSFLRFSFLDFDAEEIGNCDGPYWERFLDNMTGGDLCLRQRILEMIGVILSGYPSKTFFLLEGESNTGKSQLANFLRDILGKNACTALNDVSQLGQKWTPASLFGKLLCLCGDMPNAPLDSKAIGTIKQLTGDDLIRGEFKYKDVFTFENTAKLLLVSNYPLQIPNQYQETALLNRLIVIPCRNPVPQEQQIPALHTWLHQEAGYIVNLALEALRELEDRNGVFTPLTENDCLSLIRMSEEEEQIRGFIQDCCILREDASCKVGDVFQAFQMYAPDVQLAPANFSKLIYQLFPQVESLRRNQARMFRGICLVDFHQNQP